MGDESDGDAPTPRYRLTGKKVEELRNMGSRSCGKMAAEVRQRR